MQLAIERASALEELIEDEVHDKSEHIYQSKPFKELVEKVKYLTTQLKEATGGEHQRFGREFHLDAEDETYRVGGDQSARDDSSEEVAYLRTTLGHVEEDNNSLQLINTQLQEEMADLRAQLDAALKRNDEMQVRIQNLQAQPRTGRNARGRVNRNTGTMRPRSAAGQDEVLTGSVNEALESGKSSGSATVGKEATRATEGDVKANVDEVVRPAGKKRMTADAVVAAEYASQLAAAGWDETALGLSFQAKQAKQAGVLRLATRGHALEDEALGLPALPTKQTIYRQSARNIKANAGLPVQPTIAASLDRAFQPGAELDLLLHTGGAVPSTTSKTGFVEVDADVPAAMNGTKTTTGKRKAKEAFGNVAKKLKGKK